jgi:undecaprenyl pyrophosphate synthase
MSTNKRQTTKQGNSRHSGSNKIMEVAPEITTATTKCKVKKVKLALCLINETVKHRGVEV